MRLETGSSFLSHIFEAGVRSQLGIGQKWGVVRRWQWTGEAHTTYLKHNPESIIRLRFGRCLACDTFMNTCYEYLHV
ncbi:MAG: hypothetical protein ABJJ90_00005 [Lentilitoribacter sp.]